MADAGDLVVERREGLYCPPGDFFIDPMRPVPRAVITHAHADHARGGHGHVLAAAPGAALLRARLGGRLALQAAAYGEPVWHQGVRISLHPAGHVLGSAQVRLEHGGQVWVVSGDYAAPAPGEANATCAPFEPLRCDCFVTESTFGLPVYRWPAQAAVFAAIDAWWAANAALGRPSLLLGYSLGKAQRLLAGVNHSIGPVAVHASVAAMNQAYREGGVALPAAPSLDDVADTSLLRRALVIAPPAVRSGRLADALADADEAFASGWMLLRGMRRRRGGGRGFVLSDHADWPGLLRAVAATGAERVIVTHGHEAPLVRWLGDQGLRAGSFRAGVAGDDAES